MFLHRFSQKCGVLKRAAFIRGNRSLEEIQYVNLTCLLRFAYSLRCVWHAARGSVQLASDVFKRR